MTKCVLKVLNSSISVSQIPIAPLKTRFNERFFSLTDDHSRVVLEKIEGDPTSDYINASYIPVSRCRINNKIRETKSKINATTNQSKGKSKGANQNMGKI